MKKRALKEEIESCNKQLSLLDSAIQIFLTKGYDLTVTTHELRGILSSIRCSAKTTEEKIESIDWKMFSIQATILWEALDASLAFAQKKQEYFEALRDIKSSYC